MGKKNIDTVKEAKSQFSPVKAYSIDEILAAGGTTAFANKLGKDFQNIEKRFEKLPSNAFLNEDDLNTALKILSETK